MAINEVEPIDEYGGELPSGVRLFEIDVKDPFIDADPVAYAIIKSYIERIEDTSILSGMNYLDRSEAMKDSQRNDFTKAWLSDPKVRSLSAWRDLVPRAEALSYLTDPTAGRQIIDREGNEYEVSQQTAAQIRFVEDAVGIRDRGVAMSELLRQHFVASEQASQTVLSLASGTAEPVLLAARDAIRETGKDVSLTVVDNDDKSLRFVSDNARKVGLDGKVRSINANILSVGLAGHLKAETGLGQWSVVENMGFEEYLPQDGDEMAARKGRRLPQASEFTRRAFSLVEPGGILMSGNMVLERPQRDFVFGIVDWPLINARSEKSIMRVYERAGILGDPGAQVDMFRVVNSQSGTHIYNIVRVKKLS